MWDEWDGSLVSLVVICGVPITTIPQPQLRVKLSKIYSEAGVKPLDFAIIHWPKSLPCAHHAIFIPPLNVFSQLHRCTSPGQGFSLLRTGLSISDLS